MASLKLVLHSKQYKDGTQPVMLQCIANTGNGNIFKRRTICRITADQWDSAKCRIRRHANQVLLNGLISEAYHRAETKLLEALRAGVLIDPANIIRGGPDQSMLSANLLAHGHAYVERLAMQHQFRTAEKYKGHLKRLAQFLGTKPNGQQIDIAFLAITEDWLLQFSVWLKTHGSKSPNTIHRRMAFVGTLLLDARRRGLIHHEPMAFLKFKEQKVRKLKLSVQQIHALAQLELTGKLADARNIFLMQIYTYGARIGDAVAWRKSDVQRRGDCIYLSYRTQKTGDLLDIRLNSAAKAIIAQYSAVPGPFLLPWLQRYTPTPGLNDAAAKEELYSKIESCTTLINMHLKKLAELAGIEGNLSTHVARHSFATMADQQISDKRNISAALGHKRFSTTEVYLSDLRSDQVNDAMDVLWR